MKHGLNEEKEKEGKRRKREREKERSNISFIVFSIFTLQIH
jgi:hypothetical protein